jgi:hypothetical protein
MKKLVVLFLLLVSCAQSLYSQDLQTKNLIIITLDGLRWQEVFQGADSAILFNPEYAKDKNIINMFWDSTKNLRREKLLPFFWNVIGNEGQLYGNREYNNFVNCVNPYWFSYPGYSEMLVGFVDRKINSNDNIENHNATVLEFIHNQPGFDGKVAAFSTWEVIPSVIRESSTGIYANGGKEQADVDSLTESERLLNELQGLISNPHGQRYDAFTFYYALEYLKRESPRVVFISLDETDEHAHGGRYDQYLLSAHRTDRMINTLWNWLQSQEEYSNKTTLLITTDHGRGKGAKNSWKSHGRLSFGSSQMWFAVIGPDTPHEGEITREAQYFQRQVAKTAAAFLGFNYYNTQPVGEIIQSMFLQKIWSAKR